MQELKIPIKIRIAKFIASKGVCSRRNAEKLIEDLQVVVNGKTLQSPAFLVDENDEVLVQGKKLTSYFEKKLWLYYKPVGQITTHKDNKNRQTVFEYLKQIGLPHVISVGRLDINSEGLLLITNCPDFAHQMESPKNLVERIYRVRVFGKLEYEYMKKKLSEGITIDGIKYNPITIRLLNLQTDSKNQWLEISLTEGKNREIRKVMGYFNLMVNKLVRIQFGKFKIGNLKPTEIKEISFPD
jgi:23S rRNA pseudouridine2605 synthase